MKKLIQVSSIPFLNFFSKLSFVEETHTYTVEGSKIPSTSSLIKKYVEPFDSKKISYFVAKKRGITQKEVLAEWKAIADKACEVGTNVHLYGEDYVLGRPSAAFNLKCKAIEKFWEELPSHIQPVCLELQMYHLKYMYAGTADIILYNTKTDKYIIGDYKTNKDLFKNYKGKKMLLPFNGLLDCPLSKYKLQASYYQILLEQMEGVEVEERWVIHLLPDGTYKVHKPEDLTEKLKQELDDNFGDNSEGTTTI